MTSTTDWRVHLLYAETETRGLVCTNTHHPAQTRHRQHTTGSTAARPLFAGSLPANQTTTRIVSG